VLRTPTAGASDERHASWLELFFDLVFVVAVAQLAQELARDHSLGGFAIFAGLFLPVFIAWQGFTFYPDRFDSDDVLFRVVMLAAMLAIAALAVQIPDVANGRHDAGFVVAYVTLRSLLVALYLRAWPHAPAARRLIARYAGGYSLSIALWLASLLVDAPLRYVLWGVGLAIEYAMPVLASASTRGSRWIPATCPSASRSSRSSC
jgi:low temperature requirement protein LtrA